MKTRTIMVVTLGLGLAGVGCKKKEKDQPPQPAGSAQVAPRPSEPPPPPKPVEPPKPTPKTGKDLAQVLVDCGDLMNAAKWDDFNKQCLAASFVSHQADDQDITRDQLVPRLTDAKTAFPDLKVETQLILVNGRSLASVVLMKGTNEGPMKMEGAPTLEPTKKKLGVLLYERFAIDEENKATERWAYVDPATMAGQLGQLPKAAPPVRPALEKGLEGAPIIVVAADDEKEKANLAAVKKSIEAFNSKKLADASAVYADDAVEMDQAGPADAKGKKAMEKNLQAFWKSFSDGKVDVPNLWAAGDYVAAEGTFTGTNDGPLMGKLPKTGKKVTMQFAEVYKLKDGKITEVWRFRNGFAMMKQLGLVQPPKGAEPAKK